MLDLGLSVDLDMGSIDIELPGLSLDSFARLDSVEDPLGCVEYTDNTERDMALELSAVEQAFRDRRKAESERHRLATDSEYWVCVCFQSRKQRDEFMRIARWGTVGSKYVDGQRVAQAIGIQIPAVTVPFTKTRSDKRLSALAIPLPKEASDGQEKHE